MKRLKMTGNCWYKNRSTVDLGLANFTWKQIADEGKCPK